jgi:hypothetical protein
MSSICSAAGDRAMRWYSATVLTLCVLSPSAHGAPRDPVAAEELFLAGRTAMDQGDLQTACKRFAESERLDPAPGTLINWAECLSRRGEVASSWLKWREALEALPQADERRAGAADRIRALEPRVPRLEIRLSPDVPAGAVVQRDGVVVDPALFGLPIPVDPGPHRIAVVAPGRVTHESVETLSEAERRAIVVRAGSPLPPLAGPLAPRPPHPLSRPAPVAGWIVAGIGAAGLVTGATFGILAITEKGRMEDHCSRSSGSLFCDGAGLTAAHVGQSYATIANVAVPVGLLGLGVGGVMIWSNARNADRSVLRAGPLGNHGAELGYARTF